MQIMSSLSYLTTCMNFGNLSCIVFCAEQLAKIQASHLRSTLSPLNIGMVGLVYNAPLQENRQIHYFAGLFIFLGP